MTALRTTRNSALARPPPGCGLITASSRVPAIVRKASGISTTIWFQSRAITFSAKPPKSTVDCGRKPEPVIVAVSVAAPASAVSGASRAMTGRGYSRSIVAVADSPARPAPMR